MLEQVNETEAVEVSEMAVQEEQLPELAIIPRVVSLLFVSAKPVSSETLAAAAKFDVVQVEDALAEIRGLFQDDSHGFSLHEIAGGWQFRTAVAASPYVRRLIPLRERRLSRAAAETLAVIAYKQPVERSDIEAIRGVDALPTLRTLLDAKLIRVVGKQDTPGQPGLYGTTPLFLEKFGLRDLSDLPSLREFEQLLEEPGEGNRVAEESEEDLEFAPSDDESFVVG